MKMKKIFIAIVLLLSIIFCSSIIDASAKTSLSWKKIKKGADKVLKDPSGVAGSSANKFAIYYGKKGKVYWHRGNGENHTQKIASGYITGAKIKGDRIFISFKKEIKVIEPFAYISYKTKYNEDTVIFRDRKVYFYANGDTKQKEFSCKGVKKVYYTKKAYVVTTKPNSAYDPYGLRWVKLVKPDGTLYKYNVSKGKYY